MSMNERTAAAGSAVAWETPGTRAALGRWLARHVVKSVGLMLLWVGVLYVEIVLLPPWTAIPAAVVLAVVMCALYLSLLKLRRFWRIRRILSVYPWQQQPDGVRLYKGKAATFVLPDPDNPQKTASPKEPGGFVKLWDRIARDGFKDELWYAGDPRFAAVVAKPGLKALSYVDQPTAFNPRTSPRSKGVSPEARQRALAIGARVGPERG